MEECYLLSFSPHLGEPNLKCPTTDANPREKPGERAGGFLQQLINKAWLVHPLQTAAMKGSLEIHSRTEEMCKTTRSSYYITLVDKEGGGGGTKKKKHCTGTQFKVKLISMQVWSGCVSNSKFAFNFP